MEPKEKIICPKIKAKEWVTAAMTAYSFERSSERGLSWYFWRRVESVEAQVEETPWENQVKETRKRQRS